MIERRPERSALPTGTVTFLRTDVEGSMALARVLGPRWDEVNAEHLTILRRAIEAHGGVSVRTEGDALFAVFPEARAAVSAAIAAQRSMAEHPWPADAQVQVRMGLHSGEAHLAGDDYGGFEVNRAARIAATGHGGQIVLSDTTRGLVADALPADVMIRDLGRHALKDVPLPEALYQVDAPGLRSAFPPLRTGAAVVGDLPERMTSFVGREAEAAELGQLLETGRLVTLTGPGGIGKTSLALEVARQRASSFPDGAWFVALASLDDPAEVPSAVARTLGLFDGPERSAAQTLPLFLADRSALLVIDNFEHLIEAAPAVADILRASPRSRALVTTRTALHIAGEQEYPVRPLASEAARLFGERARQVMPGWDPGAGAAVVDEICELLDGLPLGIELAAARVAVMPLSSIRDRLAARSSLPGSGPRGVPDRQRTLEATIAWSHDLLDTDLQGLLHDLSVFEGGFDVGRAELVTADGSRRTDVFDGLVQLAEHNLIKPAANDGGGARYRLLRTIQTFALERLVDEGRELDVRRRHALAYLDLAEAGGPQMGGPDQARWLDILGVDHENLRTALAWAIDTGETEIALRFVAALWRYWKQSGHLHEGRASADAALAMPWEGTSPSVRGWAVAAGGNIAYWQAESDTARRWYEEERELARRSGDEVLEADAVFNIGHVVFLGGGDQAEIARWLDDAESRFRALGDEAGLARAQWGRGTMLMTIRQPDQAAALFESMVPRFEALGDSQYHSMTMSSLGWTSFARGDVLAAARYAITGMTEIHQLRDAASTTIGIQEGVVLAASIGRLEDAAVLAGAFEALCQRYGVRPPGALQRFLDARDPMEQVTEGLGVAAVREALERGRRMSLDEAVALFIEVAQSVVRPRQEG